MDYIEILLGALLLINSITDLCRKRISVLSIVLTGIAIIFGVARGYIQWNIMNLFGATLGISFIFMSIFLRIQIGIGDGILITILGIGLGFFEIFTVVLYALVFAVVVGIVIIKLKNKDRKYEIPFVPFLFLGYCMELFL